MSKEGKNIGKNKSRGKIDLLPEEVKSEVNSKLIKGDTYGDISGYLKELGNDISVSAVHRYGKEYVDTFKKIRMVRDFAKAITEDNPERPSTEMNETLNAILTQQLIEKAINGDLEHKDLLNFAKAAAAMQNAQTNTERAKGSAHKAAGEVKNAMNSLKLKVFNEIGEKHPELVEAIMSIADEVANQSDLKL